MSARLAALVKCPGCPGRPANEVLAVAVLGRSVAVCPAGFLLLFSSPFLDNHLCQQIGGNSITSEELRASECGVGNLLWLAIAAIPGGRVGEEAHLLSGKAARCGQPRRRPALREAAFLQQPALLRQTWCTSALAAGLEQLRAFLGEGSASRAED